MVMAPPRWRNQTITINSQALSIYPKARRPSHAARRSPGPVSWACWKA